MRASGAFAEGDVEDASIGDAVLGGPLGRPIGSRYCTSPYLSTPKTYERRKVGLPAFLLDELEPLVTERPPTAWLFTAPFGGSLAISNWNRRVFAPAVESDGLAADGLTPHSLRHTAASLAIAAGADIKVVQTMLGHKDAAITLNTYAGLFADRLDVVADALDGARLASLASYLADQRSAGNCLVR